MPRTRSTATTRKWIRGAVVPVALVCMSFEGCLVALDAPIHVVRVDGAIEPVDDASEDHSIEGGADATDAFDATRADASDSNVGDAGVTDSGVDVTVLPDDFAPDVTATPDGFVPDVTTTPDVFVPDVPTTVDAFDAPPAVDVFDAGIDVREASVPDVGMDIGLDTMPPSDASDVTSVEASRADLVVVPDATVVCPTCPSGRTCCGGICVDVLTNEQNCGSCGAICSGATVCVGGGCTTCVLGLSLCGGPQRCCTLGICTGILCE